MSHELPKTYDPSAIEPRWAEYWVKEKLFSVPTPNSGSDETQKPVFSLLLPPPNVTGSLHIGHMFEHTEMDIILRWRRMQGRPTLWLSVPGSHSVGRPCMRRQRRMMSISVCSNICPMCRLPVTLGGGSSRLKTGFWVSSEPELGVGTEKSFSLTQYSAQRGSIAEGSYVFGSSCDMRERKD